MQVVEFLLKLKIPTLILVGIVFWFGSDLVLKAHTLISLPGISGAVLLVVGAVFSAFLLNDYRYKEYTDSTIQQLSKAVEAMGKANKNYASTHSAMSKAMQDTLKGNGEIIGTRRKYQIEGSGGTTTSDPGA